MVTLDGYYAGVDGDISWHNVTAGDEFGEFANEQTGEFGMHIYGRVTYELMASYWPTQEALKSDPIIAPLMNNTPKIVFSKTLPEVKEGPSWKNITLFKDIDPIEVNKWKTAAKKDLVIFGSGTIVQQFTNLGLIDEYRLMVNPIILGKGKPLFTEPLKLKLLNTKIFKNGNVLLYYQPA